MESLGKRERSDEVTVTNDPITGYLVRPAIGGPQDIFCVPNASIHFPTFVRGDGVHVWDAQGNRYIDLIAGTFNCNIGQANAHVAEAMASQARTLTFTSLRTGRHMPALTLARRVAEVAGPGFERCLFVSGGSEGIDMAIAFLRQYAYAQGHPKKTHLISLLPSFHGETMQTMAVSGDLDFEPVYAPMVSFSAKIPAPLTYRLPDGQSPADAARATLVALEDCIIKLGPDNVLAFIIEPIGGVASGANVPPDFFFGEARRVCDKYGVFLVYDEVVTGGGRCGSYLMAQQHPEGKPDACVLAKGLGAGYVPLGAILLSAEMVDQSVALGGFALGHTYNANPVVRGGKRCAGCNPGA